METKIVKLKDLKVADYNPRKDLQAGDFRYENIKKSIDKFGLVVPIIVNKNGMRIISGHQRYKVLVQSGETEAEVVFVDLDEEKEKLLNLALNRIKGEWDFPKLSELLKEFDEWQVELTGFTPEQIEKLVVEEEPYEFEFPDDTEEIEDLEEEKAEDTEFIVYLSFEDKADALEWLKAHNISKEYKSGNNINVRLEGGEFRAY